MYIGGIVDVDEQAHVMEEAERASVYWKTLVREGVPVESATSITGMWVATWIRAMTDEPLPPRDPWDER